METIYAHSFEDLEKYIYYLDYYKNNKYYGCSKITLEYLKEDVFNEVEDYKVPNNFIVPDDYFSLSRKNKQIVKYRTFSNQLEIDDSIKFKEIRLYTYDKVFYSKIILLYEGENVIRNIVG